MEDSVKKVKEVILRKNKETSKVLGKILLNSLVSNHMFIIFLEIVDPMWLFHIIRLLVSQIGNLRNAIEKNENFFQNLGSKICSPRTTSTRLKKTIVMFEVRCFFINATLFKLSWN